MRSFYVDPQNLPATNCPWAGADTSGRGLSDVTVNDNPVTICVSDVQVADGDRVSVAINGTIVLPDVTLTNSWACNDYPMLSGPNTVTITALNTGSLGPNTVGVLIYDVISGSSSQVSRDMQTGESTSFRVTAP
ncbi:MAG: hypothetical protein Kow00124_26770 [Anaerolineae bacterium]